MSESLSNHERYTVGVLFFINVLNYMDRYTVAGVIKELQDDFHIGDEYSGLLQTAFIMAYTICAPIFGYLGDHFSRRTIMVSSVLLWTSATFGGSLTSTYGSFFVLRIFVGVGEASFSSIAPTVIYDVTYKGIRKEALGLFYIAIPIGSGLGFFAGARAARVGGHWYYALRVTPLIGIIGSLLLCMIKDPVRGEREQLEMGNPNAAKLSSLKGTIQNLKGNRSYILSTFGFTSVTFVTGALAWWGPFFLHSGLSLIEGEENLKLEDVAFKFGTIAICAGLIGVPMGAFISRKLISKYPASDPIICGVLIIFSDPLIVVVLFCANKSFTVTYCSVLVGEILLNATLTIVADILLSVVLPEYRSTAEAIQIAISHALGDAGSPYLVGLLSENLKAKWLAAEHLTPNVRKYKAMRNAFLTIVVVQLLGGMLFIVNAFYIVEDRELVSQTIATRRSVGQQAVPAVAAVEHNLIT